VQVRRACYGVIRTVMEAGALGIEVIVSGKARVQRAKSMKFKSGFLITTGNPAKMFVDKATRHCMMKQVSLRPSPPAEHMFSLCCTRSSLFSISRTPFVSSARRASE